MTDTLIRDPIVGMSLDHLDDLTWKTVMLKRGPLPFSIASTLVNQGLVMPGRTVNEDIDLYATQKAITQAIGWNPRHLTTNDVRHYADYLEIPNTIPPDTNTDWDAFKIAWQTDHRLGAIAAIHWLVGTRQGTFAIWPEQASQVTTIVNTNDLASFEDRFIRRYYGYITREEKRDALHRPSWQPA